MYNIGKYSQHNKMSDLICNNYPMVLIISRFGISLGFGDKSIGEVCKINSVDTNVFLAVVNLLIADEREPKNLSAEAIIKYLKNSHLYFLSYKLPAIRTKLTEAIFEDKNPITDMVISYFDEYVEEVNKHIMYEEDTVFVYVNKLLKEEDTQGYNIDIFCERHDNIEEKLTEFRNIIIKYYSTKSSHELNSVLFDIFSCANDLILHSNVEDYLFIPTIRDMEQQKGE